MTTTAPAATPASAPAPAAATPVDDRPLLLRIVNEAYRQSTWNGTNLRSSLEHVGAEQAGWRPPHALHSIAEVVLHSAYWKFVVRRRLTGNRGESFEFEGKNWFEITEPLDDKRWARLVDVLDEEHRKLCDAIRSSERDLDYGSSAGREMVRQLFGIAMHDAYHTGQVHLIQAQYKRARAM